MNFESPPDCFYQLLIVSEQVFNTVVTSDDESLVKQGHCASLDLSGTGISVGPYLEIMSKDCSVQVV
jgi:hypothetical protein